jgi:hypothetical protein
MSDLEKQIVKILKKSPISDKIKSIALFGSYAKGLQTNDSDIDILIELIKPAGFDFISTEILLSDILKKKIDLLTEEAISKYLINEVNNTKKVIYEK